MGSDISSNYSFSRETSRVGLWIVRRGTVLSNNKDVTFWTFDCESLKEKCKDKKMRKKYMSYLKDRLEEQQKIHNKNILRIFEISDANRTLSFSSEPVLLSFNEGETISRDESICIGIQLAHAIDYLHNNLHYANIGLSPDTIVISEKFQAKLLMFMNTVPIAQNGLINMPFTQEFLSSVSFPAKYMSPEILRKENAYKEADIYSYGVLMHDLLSSFSTDLQNTENIPDEFVVLIRNCTNSLKRDRPTPKQILESEAFSSLVADVFSYINKIILTDEKDRFSFFEGLLELIEAFSPRIFMHMFIPLFIDQMGKEKRFTIVILPIIYKFVPKLSTEQTEKTIESISFLFKITRPPQIIETTLENLYVILSKIDPKKILLPLFTGLQSEDLQMTEISYQACHIFRDKMKPEDIQTEIIEQILPILKKTVSPDIARALITALSIFIQPLDKEYLFVRIIPALIDIWMRTEWIQISEPICNCIMQYDGPPAKMMKSAAALATMMLGDENVESDIQIKLINILSKSVIELKKTREFLSQKKEIDLLDTNSAYNTQITHAHSETDSPIPSSSGSSKSTPKQSKRTPRPSLTKFNPFDGAPMIPLSHDGELIYCSSKGEFSDIQSNSDNGASLYQTQPVQPTYQKNKPSAYKGIPSVYPQQNTITTQITNLIHKRSGSGPTNTSIIPSTILPHHAYTNNLSENPVDAFSSDLLTESNNPSESLGTDSTYSYKQPNTLIPQARQNYQRHNPIPLIPNQRQSISHETFFGPTQIAAPRSLDSHQRTPPREIRQTVQYQPGAFSQVNSLTPVMPSQYNYNNQFVSDSFNLNYAFRYDNTTPQVSPEVPNSTSFPSFQQQQQQQQIQQGSVQPINPQNFDDFDFED